MPSSFFLSTLLPHCSTPPLLKASSFCSLKPRRTQRPNRLRQKLLEFPTLHQPLSSPPPPIHSPPPSPSTISDETPVSHLFVVQEDAGEEEAVFEEEAAPTLGLEPTVASAQHRLFPKDVMGLALRFSLLLAVQTAVAVWVLGGRREEDNRVHKNQVNELVESGRRAGNLTEFERKVLKIRSMAKEAKEQESMDLAEKESGVKGEVNKRLERLRKKGKLVTLNDNGYSSSPLYSYEDNGVKSRGENSNSQKKLGFLSSHANSRDVAKGFPGLKKKDENGGKGGIKQIADHHTSKEPDLTHKRSEQANGKSHSPKNQNVLEDFTSSSVQISSKREDFVQVGSSVGPAPVENASMLKNEASQSRKRSEKNSGIDRKFISNSEKLIDDEPLILDSLDGHFDAMNKPWWLKLPYVLCILLRRGPNNDDPRGLYCLHLSSSRDDEHATSYTVAFEDHGDATNFCYLLESFFEEMDGATANAVPVTIKELHEAVESRELNVFVVRRGQLRMYAGQPLADAEAALCSLIKYIL